jgi:hypothetical protein
MKLTPWGTAVALSVCVAALVGCGGGGDDNAGSLTPFSVVPDEFKVTTTADGCPVGGTPPQGTFFVYGGAAPYRLDNTSPDRVALNKTIVNERGGSFTATFLGGCVVPMHVVIVDANDRQVTVELTFTDEEN